MFNTDQWFLNSFEDTLIQAYGPTGVASTPAPFNYTVLDPCGVGTYTGEIQLVDCAVQARVGIGTGLISDEVRVDVSGSVKIDEFIYDSVNSNGNLGYILSTDNRGIRWVPPLSPPPGLPPFDGGAGAGSTTFFFILDEGIPVVGFGTTDIPVA